MQLIFEIIFQKKSRCNWRVVKEIQMQLTSSKRNPYAIGEFFKNSEKRKKNPDAIGENPDAIDFL